MGILNKLSTKLTAIVIIVIIAVVGGASAIYCFFAEDYYVYKERTIIEQVFSAMKNIDFTSETDELDDLLESHAESNLRCVITNENFDIIYFSYKDRLAKKDVSRFSNIDLFEFNNGDDSADIQIEADKYSKIVLRNSVVQNGTKYYVSITERLDTIGNTFKYSINFLVIVVVLTVLIMGITIHIVIRRTSKTLTELEKTASKISDNDLSVRCTAKITEDEVGRLAVSVNKMADKIQNNINNLNNYNFLLHEDIKRLNEYDEMRKKVVSNLTHELKTPLAIISSQIEMLQYTKVPEKKIFYYNSAMDEVAKMSTLISDILNVSSFEKKLFAGSIERINVSTEIETLCKKWKGMTNNRGVALDSVIENGCTAVVVKNNIDHVFNNYMMNALNHVKPEGLIRVKLKRVENGLKLSVFNEGEPISDADKKGIWTEYYQGDVQSENEDVNFGLGLFIVKEISHIENTECGVENIKNGVNFWFLFKNQKITEENHEN